MKTCRVSYIPLILLSSNGVAFLRLKTLIALRKMPNPQSLFKPDISSAFAKLSKAERLYAYYMSQAAWACAPIAQQQKSPESRPLFSLINEIGKRCGCNWEELSRRTGASSIAVETFLDFSARVLSGMGNYEVGN